MVLHHLDHFFRARHVCGDWRTASAFIAKGVCVSGSMETIQASAGAIVVLLHCRIRPLVLLSGTYVSNLDLLSSFQPTNITDCEPMVHFSNVVLAGLRVGPGT